MEDHRPKLLDLYCGAGGAAMGYYKAGFDVTGIDIKPQPHYPFAFIQADALEYLANHGNEFDAIHTSPPCQAYSIMRNLPWLRDKDYPLLIEPTREMLLALGKPFAIENVMGARKKANMQAGWLCGTMFGRPFYRHRLFETNFFWLAPGHPRHQFTVRNGRMLGARASDIVFGSAMPSLKAWQNGAQERGCGYGHAAGVDLVRKAMEIDWMGRDELMQAIPPVYTEYIGRALIKHIGGRNGQEDI